MGETERDAFLRVLVGYLRGTVAGPWKRDEQVAELARLAVLLPAMLWGLREVPAVSVETRSLSPRLESRFELAEENAVCLVIASAVLARSWSRAVNRLVHEWAHVLAVVIDHAPELGYRGHGPAFCRWANAAGVALGAEVAVAKSTGDSHPTDWPKMKAEVPRARGSGDSARVKELERVVERLRVVEECAKVLRTQLTELVSTAERQRDDVFKKHGKSGGPAASARTRVAAMQEVVELVSTVMEWDADDDTDDDTEGEA